LSSILNHYPNFLQTKIVLSYLPEDAKAIIKINPKHVIKNAMEGTDKI
jgi:hypothetical protein